MIKLPVCTRRVRALAVSAGAISALAMAAAPAQAHAYLIDSVPASKQEVLHSLPRIKLVFSGKADAIFSTVTLLDGRGETLTRSTQKEASREMVLPAPALDPGVYRLHYRVLSTDGDIVEGNIDFTVRNGRDG